MGIFKLLRTSKGILMTMIILFCINTQALQANCLSQLETPLKSRMTPFWTKKQIRKLKIILEQASTRVKNKKGESFKELTQFYDKLTKKYQLQMDFFKFTFLLNRMNSYELICPDGKIISYNKLKKDISTFTQKTQILYDQELEQRKEQTKEAKFNYKKNKRVIAELSEKIFDYNQTQKIILTHEDLTQYYNSVTLQFARYQNQILHSAPKQVERLSHARLSEVIHQLNQNIGSCQSPQDYIKLGKTIQQKYGKTLEELSELYQMTVQQSIPLVQEWDNMKISREKYALTATKNIKILLEELNQVEKSVQNECKKQKSIYHSKFSTKFPELKKENASQLSIITQECMQYGQTLSSQKDLLVGLKIKNQQIQKIIKKTNKIIEEGPFQLIQLRAPQEKASQENLNPFTELYHYFNLIADEAELNDKLKDMEDHLFSMSSHLQESLNQLGEDKLDKLIQKLDNDASYFQKITQSEQVLKIISYLDILNERIDHEVNDEEKLYIKGKIHYAHSVIFQLMLNKYNKKGDSSHLHPFLQEYLNVPYEIYYNALQMTGEVHDFLAQREKNQKQLKLIKQKLISYPNLLSDQVPFIIYINQFLLNCQNGAENIYKKNSVLKGYLNQFDLFFESCKDKMNQFLRSSLDHHYANRLEFEQQAQAQRYQIMKESKEKNHRREKLNDLINFLREKKQKIDNETYEFLIELPEKRIIDPTLDLDLETDSSAKPNLEVCSICWDKFPAEQLIKCQNKSSPHLTCQMCLKQILRPRFQHLQEGKTVGECITPKCHHGFNAQDLFRGHIFKWDEMEELYLREVYNKCKNQGDFISCDNPYCRYGVFPVNAIDYHNFLKEGCKYCESKKCSKCKRKAHNGKSCQQYFADHLLELQKFGAKMCPKCWEPTYHGGACMHMTCNKCGENWSFITNLPMSVQKNKQTDQLGWPISDFYKNDIRVDQDGKQIDGYGNLIEPREREVVIDNEFKMNIRPYHIIGRDGRPYEYDHNTDRAWLLERPFGKRIKEISYKDYHIFKGRWDKILNKYLSQ